MKTYFPQEDKYLDDEFKHLSVVNTNMTSDIALRLSNERMIAVTDEQVSTYFDEANIASKLAVKGKYVALISGRGGTTKEMIEEWKSFRLGNFTEEMENLTKIFHEIYKKTWIGDVLKKEDLDDEEYKTGVLKNGKPIATYLLRKKQSETDEFVRSDSSRPGPKFNSYVIFAGQDEKRNDMEIYEIKGAGTHELVPDRFCAEGSGSIKARTEIIDFIESLPPEKRDDIDFGEGLHVSMRALVKSQKAPGVGGAHPAVAFIEKDSVRKLDSKKSAVMRNVVFKELKGEIEENKAKSYLESLANDKIDTLSVAKEIYKPEDLEKYGLYT